MTSLVLGNLLEWVCQACGAHRTRRDRDDDDTRVSPRHCGKPMRRVARRYVAADHDN